MNISIAAIVIAAVPALGLATAPALSTMQSLLRHPLPAKIPEGFLTKRQMTWQKLILFVSFVDRLQVTVDMGNTTHIQL